MGDNIPGTAIAGSIASAMRFFDQAIFARFRPYLDNCRRNEAQGIIKTADSC